MKLKASSNSSHHDEVSMEEANARFLKYLHQVNSLSKGLEEEVTAAPNTKREIKALIIQLSNGVKGLMQWGRRTGKVCASTYSRGTQTDPDTTKKNNAEKRTTEVQTSPRKENVDGVMPASENTILSPDRSRLELPAAIEGLRQMVISQGEVIAKLVEKVENTHGKPAKPQQRRQQKTPPRQNAQLYEEQQPLRSDSQDQPLSGTAEKWETVSRRGRKKESYTRVRPDAVIVKADNMSYADMLKKIKTSGEMKEVGETINGITKTKDGHLRIVLSRETKEIENLKTAIKNTIGNEASCTRLSDTAEIEIRDADEEATNEEILEAIEAYTKNKGSAKIINQWKTNRGTQIITASVPTSAINTMLNTRMRIGFVNCRVKRKLEVKKCFRCQGYGHTRVDCTNEERSDHCWKCGVVGHKSKECQGQNRCMLCKEEATDDHILGSYRCHTYIMYEVKENSPRRAQQVCTGWQIKKLDMGKLKQIVKAESDSRQASCQTAAAGAENYCSKLTHIADKCMPRRNGKHNKPPVYWWSEEMAQLRRDCIKCKRSYQRKRRKRNEQECTEEARLYKESRKSLVKEIKIAKAKCWQQLCLEVERDPWGQPYKIAMKKLCGRRPILGAEVPGRIDAIVDKLFPRKERTLEPNSITEEGNVWAEMSTLWTIPRYARACDLRMRRMGETKTGLGGVRW
ncbi:hypothetical protein ACI65C_006414 [Semiaphis heraclei]